MGRHWQLSNLIRRWLKSSLIAHSLSCSFKPWGVFTILQDSGMQRLHFGQFIFVSSVQRVTFSGHFMIMIMIIIINYYLPNEWMSHYIGRNNSLHSHFIYHFTVGQLDWDVWFDWVGMADTSECIFEPPLLGEGFWMLFFGVLGHRPSELWPLYPTYAMLW